MNTQLEAYAASNGQTLKIGRRSFEVVGITSDGDIALATFKTKRASYTGVLRNNVSVAGLRGAEVWAVLGGKRTIAQFAVSNGGICALAG